MAGKVASTIALVIFGIVIADILTHPAGVSATSAGITQIEKPTFNALLGQTS